MPSVFLHHLETAVPETAYTQESAAHILQRLLGRENRRTARLIQSLYCHSGIQKRHTVIDSAFYNAATGEKFYPTTRERNALYTTAARRLAPELAARTIDNCPGVERSQVTHLVTVSCTGFFQPGPDLAIVEALGLNPGVERYHLGFMGCYAAFPALRMAQAFCQANPEAVVLVLCLELCSLHVQWSEETDDLLAGAVFADGAAAAIVRATPPEHGGLRLDTFASALAPGEEKDMAWTIGDQGFQMRLSTYIPQLLASGIGPALAPLLTKAACTVQDIDHWAVHPGGRAILDKVEQALCLPTEALAESREVLRDYGNMSSATILFVLKRVLERSAPGERIAAVAFGPGLTVESAVLTRQ